VIIDETFLKSCHMLNFELKFHFYFPHLTFFKTRSQIVNLIHGHSFGHNTTLTICNGNYKPTFNVYSQIYSIP